MKTYSALTNGAVCRLILYTLRLQPTRVKTCSISCRVHSPTNALLYFKKHIKIYVKIHINIAPTCFGLRPSSGSLH